MNNLLKAKVDTLNQLSVLCGAPIRSNKLEKSRQLLITINFYLQLPSTVNLVAVDIGIKNFSYCKIPRFNVEQFPCQINVLFDNWKTINLLDKYPPTEEFNQFNRYNSFESNDLLYSKYYLGYLNYKVLHDLINFDSENLNLVMIETQRTKSNNNKVTLPNVLDNYHFENLFYANLVSTALTAGDIDKTKIRSQLLLPMNSSKMSNFMINRFLDKSQISSSNSKKLRNKMLIHLINKKIVNIESLEIPIDSKNLMKFYNSHEPIPIKKLDDLFDSLLYNMNIISNYSNSLWLNYYLRQDWDLKELVQMLNSQPVSTFKNLFDDSVMNESFRDMELVQRPELVVNRELWEID